MRFILGTKEKMTQVFTADGKVVPATVIVAGPAVVLQVKTKEKDGYSAVQIGFGERKEKRINKPLKGHFKNLGNFRFVREGGTMALTNEQIQRYSRHLIMPEVGVDGQEKLLKSSPKEK